MEEQKTDFIDTPEDYFNSFLAVIKNKDDADYVIKVRGSSKENASKKGLMKCKQTYPDLSGSGNTGCYVHYSSKVGFGQ